MKKAILICMIATLLMACKEEEKVPDYVMSEDEFTEVLTEFQITEAIVRLGYHRTPDSLILNDSMYASIFRKLNITQDLFDSNYTYYSMHPEKLEKMYETVITNLSTRSAELMEDKNKLKKD